MKRHIAVAGLAATLAFGGLAVAPAVVSNSGSVAIEAAEAAPAPGGGGGGSAGSGSGGSVEKAGENAADLLAGWVVPVLFAIVGVFSLVALSQRSLAPALLAVFGGLLAGFFLIDPKGAQDMFEGIYSTVF